MTGSAGKTAGIISIVLSVVAALAGVLNYAGRHTRRGLAALIACGILLILGIVLLVVARGGSQQTPTT